MDTVWSRERAEAAMSERERMLFQDMGSGRVSEKRTGRVELGAGRPERNGRPVSAAGSRHGSRPGSQQGVAVPKSPPSLGLSVTGTVVQSRNVPVPSPGGRRRGGALLFSDARGAIKVAGKDMRMATQASPNASREQQRFQLDTAAQEASQRLLELTLGTLPARERFALSPRQHFLSKYDAGSPRAALQSPKSSPTKGETTPVSRSVLRKPPPGHEFVAGSKIALDEREVPASAPAVPPSRRGGRESPFAEVIEDQVSSPEPDQGHVSPKLGRISPLALELDEEIASGMSSAASAQGEDLVEGEESEEATTDALEDGQENVDGETEDEDDDDGSEGIQGEADGLVLVPGIGAANPSLPLVEKRENGTYPARMWPSLFEGGRDVVAFVMDPQSIRHFAPCKTQDLFYRKRAPMSNAFRHAMSRAGFRVTETDTKWTVVWSYHLPPEEYRAMSPYQKTNHFPGTWELGRKDLLARNIGRNLRKFGERSWGFHPRSWSLPAEANELVSHWQQNPSLSFILKPKSSSRGRGIRVLNRLADLPTKKSCLIQSYIERPYMVPGVMKKFDMRLYVVVTCMEPLRCYMWPEGLVRFATEDYEGTSKKSGLSKFAHLTNFSINKKNVGKFNYNTDENKDDEGSKWSTHALAKRLDDLHGPGTWQRIWDSMEDMVVKSLISCEARVNGLVKLHTPQSLEEPPVQRPGFVCYEVFGYDVMLDSELKPWLIEVNVSPALDSSSPLDKRIKHNMITTMLNLVGVVPYDRKEAAIEGDAQNRARLFGRGPPGRASSARTRTPAANPVANGRMGVTANARNKFAQGVERAVAQAKGAPPPAHSDHKHKRTEYLRALTAFVSAQVLSKKQPASMRERGAASSAGRRVKPGQPVRRMTSTSSRMESLSAAVKETRATQAAKRTAGSGRTAGDRKPAAEASMPFDLLSDLTAEDVAVLRETVDEDARKGAYLRVYPRPGGLVKYRRYFDSPKYVNELVGQFVDAISATEDGGVPVGLSHAALQKLGYKSSAAKPPVRKEAKNGDGKVFYFATPPPTPPPTPGRGWR